MKQKIGETGRGTAYALIRQKPDKGEQMNERQVRAVMYVKKRGRITNKEYKDLTGASKPMATIDLRDIVDKRVFEK